MIENFKKSKHPFTFIDLFAGIGGMRIPFSEAGGICVFSSEIDTHAKLTYRTNFFKQPRGDITEIDELEIPKHDILLAGFQCQSFSQAGLRNGFTDTRGTLFFEITRIAKYHRPKMILLENVKGLITHDHGSTLKVILNVLQGLNYTTLYKVLNARDFGLPQNRERLYFVALHNRKMRNKIYEFPIPPYSRTQVKDILEPRVPDKYTLSKKLWNGHVRRKSSHVSKGNGFGYRLFKPASEYTSTLSARYYKDGSEILIQQKRKIPRKLTPREAARLQGFTDDFVIPVSDTQAYKQFGNTVAVPVIRAISIQVLKTLYN